MKPGYTNLCLLIAGCLFFACSKTKQPVIPEPVEVDPPYVWPQNATYDVRNLHVVPYAFNQRFEPIEFVSELKFDNWLAKPVSKPDFGKMVSNDLAAALYNLILINSPI
jgi:hypothetical protein